MKYLKDKIIGDVDRMHKLTNALDWVRMMMSVIWIQLGTEKREVVLTELTKHLSDLAKISIELTEEIEKLTTNKGMVE